MSIYKIQPLVESGFDFSTIFPEKQKALQQFGGFNFGLQEIANLLKTQTENFTIKNEVALDIDKYIYEAYEKHLSLTAPEEAVEQPKEEKKKTVEDYEKLIKGYSIKLKGAKTKEDKEWIGKKIKGYEIKLKSLKNKKEQGGEMIIETQHSFGDPKENTDPKIDLSFSAKDPKKEDGGILESVKLRNIQSGKISDWDLSEVIESINQSGEGSGVVYDEKNWLDGFDNISKNYSLLDESGNALNEFANYSKGGALSSDDKKNISEFIKTIENEVQSKNTIKKPRELFFGDSEVKYKLEWKQDEQDEDMYLLRLLRFNDEFKKYVEEDSMRDSMFIIYAKLEDYRDNFYNYAKGGGFEKLAKHVAKEYEGHKVAPEHQKEYGKKYSHEEAVEVGKKVAAKVYREQLAKK